MRRQASFLCRNRHRWAEEGDERPGAPRPPATCPVCGAEGEPVDAAGRGPAGGRGPGEEPAATLTAPRGSGRIAPGGGAETMAGPTAVEGFRDYRLLEKLGEGGMGVVYRAMHTRLRRVVALKLLAESSTRAPDAVARFAREMEAVGRLDDPHIVRASDAGEHDGRHFLVMEYVDGCDVERLARQVGRVPVLEACELIRQAAVGLQHAHENGLVHRDVKPSNLLITRGGLVKVADLGLALLGGPAGRPALTDPGLVMGTLDYMAPEQARDPRAVDIRADIYGLGATLFRLLTGWPPLHDPTVATVWERLEALATRRAPSIAVRRDDLPGALVRLVDRMLAAERDERPSTAAEVVEALAPLATGSDLPGLLGRLPRAPAPEATVGGPDAGRQRPGTERPGGPGAGAAATGWADAGRRGQAVFLAIALLVLTVAVTITVMAVGDPEPHPDVGAASASASASDRDLAVEVLPMGGSLDILQGEQSLSLSGPGAIPPSAFSVEEIFLTANRHVDDRFLARLTSLQRLRAIYLQGTGITDRGAGQLGRIATLEEVFLSEMPVSDAGLAPVTALPLLRTLVISKTDITDRTLERLRGRPRLHDLRLKGTGITDAGLEPLGGLPHLERLDLRDTGIGDGGLRHLRSLATLRILRVGGTQVTEEGLAWIASALPGCRIDREE